MYYYTCRKSGGGEVRELATRLIQQLSREGDEHLDWDGPEAGQGLVPGENDEEYEVSFFLSHLKGAP